MPWLQLAGDRMYFDTIVKARAHAVHVLEGVHPHNPLAPWYHPSTGVPIYAKAKSRSPMGAVKYDGGRKDRLAYVAYDRKYGANSRPMYKNGKLM